MKEDTFRIKSSRSFDDVTSSLVTYFSGVKANHFPDKVMTVGISGLSRSGKTTLANSLGERIGSALVIDADMYQVGRELGMPVYEKVLRDLREGGSFDKEFHHKVWRYEAMREQVFDAVRAFNSSTDSRATLYLKDVIDVPGGKRSDSMHDEQYGITRDTTILLPLMFQQHMADCFDRMVTLDIKPDVSVERKLEKVPDRDPVLTREMVTKVEHPVMVYQEQEYPTRDNIRLDTNDFDRVFTS